MNDRITGPSLAAVNAELERDGWKLSYRDNTHTHYFHHPDRRRLAAVSQRMPSGKGVARIIANW